MHYRGKLLEGEQFHVKFYHSVEQAVIGSRMEKPVDFEEALEFWMFAVLRFFSGFFIAGPSATVYAYLGEFHGAKYRTISITCASIFVAIAIFVLPGIAWYVLPQQWSWNILNMFEYKPWRLFLVLSSLPCLVVAVALLPFPESPKFLLLRGKRPEALAVLKKVYAYNTGKKADDFPVQDITETYTEEDKYVNSRFSLLKSMWNQTAPLFRTPHVLSTFVACSLQFGLFAVSSGLLLWYPEIVNQLAEHERKYPGTSITVCEAISPGRRVNTTHIVPCSDGVDISVFQQNLIIGLAYAVGFVVITLIVNKLGKRTLLVFCLVASGGCGIALCWMTNRLVIDFLFNGLLVLSGICVSIVNAAVVELFPTYLRAMAMCISLMSGRLGSVVASSTIGVLLEIDCIATFVIFSTILFEEGEAVDFEHAISSTGFGLYNIILLIVCGISLMSVIMETVSMSYILPAAQCDLDLTLADKSILSSVGFLGVVISSLLWGFIGDTAGRRNVVVITSYISFLMGVASSFAPYVWLFIVLRFLNCFFIGGPSAVVIGYLGEFHGNLLRSRVISWSATFVAIASLVLPGVAWLLLPMDWAFEIPGLDIVWRPWRLLIIIYGAPSFISATCLLFFPESPKFLWTMGKSNEALDILKNIYNHNTGKGQENFPVKQLAACTENIQSATSTDNHKRPCKFIFSFLIKFCDQVVPIFKSPLLFKTFMTSFLQFGVFAGTSGLLMWLPEILNRMLFYMEVKNTNSVTVCDAMDYNINVTDEIDLETTDCLSEINEEVFVVSLIIGTAFALNYMFIGTVIYYTGKRYLLAGVLLVSGISGFIVNFIEDYLTITILSGLFIVGGAGVTILNTAVVDLFPTQYRSIAMAVSLMAGRGGAMVASPFLSYLLEYNCIAVYYIIGGGFIILAGVSLVLPEH
ncbi:uncharacterized protein CBL_04942 [Carabus blaptoides fortunei]